MSVFRIEKTNNYTTMSNYHLRDRNLTHKARGLLSYMLSLPDDWDYSVNGLVSFSKENIRAIRSTLKELEECGYLVREKRKLKNGRFDYEYFIYEIPYKQNVHTENVYAKKDIQLNTNILKDKLDKSNEVISHNNFTIELIKNEYIDKDENEYVLCCYDNLFNSLLEYNSYQDIAMMVYYFLKRVKLNEYKDEKGELIINRYGYLKNAINSNIKKLQKLDEEIWW